jgi:hypothetical protein
MPGRVLVSRQGGGYAGGMLRFAVTGFALGLLSASAAAEPLDAAAFARLAGDRTLHFSSNGQPFGAEQFFSRNRSLWRYADGECAHGRWWQEAELICFAYDREVEASCWRISDQAGQVRAELMRGGAGTGFVLELERIEAAPLPCPGPDIGS